MDDFDPFESADPARRRYWSERHGRGPRSKPVSGDQLRELLFNVFDEFDDRGYFQEHWNSLKYYKLRIVYYVY